MNRTDALVPLIIVSPTVPSIHEYDDDDSDDDEFFSIHSEEDEHSIAPDSPAQSSPPTSPISPLPSSDEDGTERYSNGTPQSPASTPTFSTLTSTLSPPTSSDGTGRRSRHASVDQTEASMTPDTKRALSQISVIRSSFRTLQSRSTFLSTVDSEEGSSSSKSIRASMRPQSAHDLPLLTYEYNANQLLKRLDAVDVADDLPVSAMHRALTDEIEDALKVIEMQKDLFTPHIDAETSGEETAVAEELSESEMGSEDLDQLGPLPNDSDSQTIIDAFLTDDEGKSLLYSVEGQPGVIISRPPSSGFSFSRIGSIFTTDSLASHIGAHGVILPLKTLCDLIAQCASLERAKIVSVECYKEWSKYGVLHRFLIFHLRRPKRSDVWMRLDRKAVTGISVRRFIRARGKTQANDTARLAASKADLFDGRRVKLENELTFDVFPHLGAFRFFLMVICEELVEYHIWPENCWFMCSMLQEHLAEANNGRFVAGNLVNLDLARDIRTRIYDRVYHIPEGARISELLQSLTVTGPYWRDIYLPKAVVLAETFDYLRTGSEDGLPESHVVDVSEALRDLSSRAEPLQGCQLASRSVAFYRKTYLSDPEKYADRLIAALNTYVDRLSHIPTVDASRRACDALWQIAAVCVDLYERNPKSRASHNKLIGAIRACVKEMRKSWSTEDPEWNPLAQFMMTYRELYMRDPERWYNELHPILESCFDFIEGFDSAGYASKASRELVEMYRPAYEANPASYRRAYVSALEAQVDGAFRAQRYDEACEISRSIVQIFRAEYEQQPNFQSRSALSVHLDKHARRLFKARYAAKACDALQEVVTVHRAQYVLDPAHYHHDLVDALNAYAAGLTTAGRVTDAQEAYQEVADIQASVTMRYQPLTSTSPSDVVSISEDGTAVEPLPYDALPAINFNTSSPTTDHGDSHAALEDIATLVERYRAHYIEEPSAEGYDDLTWALSQYAEQLASEGQLDKASNAAYEIVQIDRAQYAVHPTEHGERLANSLSAYAKRLSAIGLTDDACETSLEAVAIDRSSRSSDPHAYISEPTLERLHACCQRLIKAGRHREALQITVDTVEALRSQEDTISPYWLNEWAQIAETLKQEAMLGSRKKRPALRFAETTKPREASLPALPTITRVPSAPKRVPQLPRIDEFGVVENADDTAHREPMSKSSTGSLGRTPSQKRSADASLPKRLPSAKKPLVWEIDKWNARKAAQGLGSGGRA